MRLRIHRGTREIGGTCIELESGGSRILLDLGLPLDAKDLASMPLPKIEGLAGGSSTLLAIVLSHGHRDHWGLIPKVNPKFPWSWERRPKASTNKDKNMHDADWKMHQQALERIMDCEIVPLQG